MNLIKGLVSVIIPTFNNAPYLHRCVDSVLAQTYGNLEIIVVDDGSSDNPLSALSDVSDPRFRGVISMPHKGVSTARNVGIQYALGEYIVFIDGDDWVEPSHLELLVDGLKEADCAMIMMQIDYPDRSEVNVDCLKLSESCPLIKRADFNLLFENYLLSSPCNKIYKTSLVKQTNFLQFDRSISYAEDLLFNLEYFRMISSVVLKTDATYHYIKHGESGTTRYHANTAYTLSRISTAVSKLLGPNLSYATLSILMRHYLWGMFNLHHKGSTQNDAQILSEIGLISSIPEYQAALRTIAYIGISKKLQFLLKAGNSAFIHYAFKHLPR